MYEVEAFVFKIPEIPRFKRMRKTAKKETSASLSKTKKTEEGRRERREKGLKELKKGKLAERLSMHSGYFTVRSKKRHNQKLNDTGSSTSTTLNHPFEPAKPRKRNSQLSAHYHLQPNKLRFNDFYVGPLTLDELKSGDFKKEKATMRKSMKSQKRDKEIISLSQDDYRLVRQNAFRGTWPILSTY